MKIHRWVLIKANSAVKAVDKGYILVLDEVDKAPTHVTSILRHLLQGGEMLLTDGRKILSRKEEKSENNIVMHPVLLARLIVEFQNHCFGQSSWISIPW